MTDEQTIEILLNTDPEVQYLAKQVHARNDLKPTVREVMSIRDNAEDPDVKKLGPVELFATYKCQLAWAVMINKVWDKLCGDCFSSRDKQIPIPGTTKKLLIYHFSPSSKDLFRFEDDKIYVREDADITDDTVQKQRIRCVVEFKLQKPNYYFDDDNHLIVDLGNSLMSIGTTDDEEPLTFKVKDFSPAKLIEAIIDGPGWWRLDY